MPYLASLQNTVADLASCGLRDRLKGTVVRGRCGQDCGQAQSRYVRVHRRPRPRPPVAERENSQRLDRRPKEQEMDTTSAGEALLPPQLQELSGRGMQVLPRRTSSRRCQ